MRLERNKEERKKARKRKRTKTYENLDKANKTKIK